MKRTTSVVQLKARLSEYLRMVKAGHEVVITGTLDKDTIKVDKIEAAKKDKA